ncbi:Flp pilus assembly protein TadG [Beijerinckiaceae bacterium RH AL1]|nr:pilus assembly protein TadG-related protein [Beijerinckiaceae bacterium]VVB42814.1 Flp pilus assembly protein TadG [Beijerinckiaceae bacterium RH AL8]VVB42825.1 Flp pilus assembly protein TadG [Beijerinckiaceae bacterium RH CH11]VVC53520.1 Flp pilus assembly protein TadG [Beijerinckiaceae bacterium RH AL1]
MQRLFLSVGKVVCLLRSYASDRRGNVAILVAITMIPMVGLVGLGTDYGIALTDKSKLDNAADTAAIAAVSAAKSYVTANPNDLNLTANALAAGLNQATRSFNVNMGNLPFATIPTAVTSTTAAPSTNTCAQGSVCIYLSQTLSTFTSTVYYNTTTQNHFGQLFQTPTFNIKGSAASSLTMGQYIDFYVMLDVSGSMGIPTTTDGQNALAKVNPDNRSSYPGGCVFACHYPGNSGYATAEGQNSSIPVNPPIPLRVDTVGQAVSSLLSTATATEQQSGIANEFRIGLYPYIVHAIDAAPLSANFAQATKVSQSLGSTYLDQGWSNPPTSSNGTAIGSGGTHFENFLNDMTNYIKTPISNGKVGNGLTALNPKGFIFLVTDGVDNNQVYNGSNGSWTGSQPQIPGSSFSNFCSTAATYGFTVAILYIPYVPIANPNYSFAGNEDGIVNQLVTGSQDGLQTPPVNQVPPALQSCASPGFFFTASSQQAINQAMQTMFFQALQVARLTQ